jgi:hypothetical protein
MASLETASFDFVIDKGCFDALHSNRDEKTNHTNGCRMLAEVGRVLKPSGTFWMCTIKPPDLFLPLLPHGGQLRQQVALGNDTGERALEFEFEQLARVASTLAKAIQDPCMQASEEAEAGVSSSEEEDAECVMQPMA